MAAGARCTGVSANAQALTWVSQDQRYRGTAGSRPTHLTMETPDLSQNARPSSISGSPQIFFRNTSSRWTPPLLHSLESIGCFFEEAEHFLTLIGFRRC